MTTLREAAQQALEALGCIEYGINGIEYGPSDDTTESAITALRAALAQQEQEPVTLERERAVELTRAYQEGYEHGSRNAQQEQEPPTQAGALHAMKTVLWKQEQEQDWSMLEATQASLREHMAEVNRLRAALKEKNQ